MRSAIASLAVSVVLTLTAAANTAAPSPADAQKARESLAGLPILFERNQGQYPERYDFGSRAHGQSFFIAPNGAEIGIPGTKGATIELSFPGARRNPELRSAEPAVTRANYLIGRDPSRWIIGVPTYSNVAYDDVYRGIDLVYHGTQKQLEYDFVVSAGADPKQIRLRFDATEVVLDENGDLLLKAAAGQVVNRRPIAYQLCAGERRIVPAHYRMTGPNEVAFTLGQYDPDAELVIDPMIEFSAFIGGLGDESVESLALDPSGNIYVAGGTAGSPFLATAGVVQTVQADRADQEAFHSNNNSYDGYITKLAAGGSSILYRTYLGGEGSDRIYGIAIDGTGHAIVGGETRSKDFPTTVGAALPELPNGFGDYALSPRHGFVARLNSTGTAFVYSTYIGADTFYTDETVIDVATDNTGAAWVTGETRSQQFPVTAGAYQPELAETGTFLEPDGFVMKLSPTGAILHSTYLGGPHWDRSDGVAVDASGNVYVRSRSSIGLFGLNHFPTTPGAFRNSGAYYVSKLNPSLSTLLYSTAIAGDENRNLSSEGVAGGGLAVDTSGNAYVTGYAEAGTLSTTSGAHRTSSCGRDAFVVKLNPTGTAAIYSTYLVGGTGCSTSTIGYDIAIDSSGNAYVGGMTTAPHYPTINGLQAGPLETCSACVGDGFIMKLSPAGQPIDFSTTYGSTAADDVRAIAISGSAIVVAGQTSPGNALGFADLWHVNPPLAAPNKQTGRIFVAKINLAAPAPAPGIVGFSHAVRAGDQSGYNTANRLFIRGFGFQEDATVTVGSLPTRFTATVVDPTLIQIDVPVNVAGTYEVVVRNPDGTELRKNGLRYMLYPSLVSCGTVKPITPETGSVTGGTPIVIRGNNFQPGAAVTVGATLATNVNYVSPTEIHAVTPPGRSGHADVLVINPDGTFTSTQDRCGAFTYRGLTPVISSMTPTTIRANAEIPLTFTGTNFTGARPAVRISSGSMNFIQDSRVVNDTTMTAISPLMAPGLANIIATSDPFNADSNVVRLNVIPEESVTPNHGPTSGGTELTIRGLGFQPGARVFLRDGEELTNVVVVDSTTITGTTPPKSLAQGGQRGVTVINPNGQSFTFAGQFTYLNQGGAVTIDSVTPNSGFTTGGETITVTGTGFDPPQFMDILIGGFVPTDVTLVDENTLTMKTPPHVAGPADVVIWVAGTGEPGAVLEDGFTYVDGPPIVQFVTPSRGVPEGGTAIEIRGASFLPGATVTIGGNPLLNTQVFGATLITGTTPAHALGPVNVVVTNPDAQTGTGANAFTYAYPGLTLTPAAPTVMPGTNQTMTVTLDTAQATDTIVSLTAGTPSLITMPSTVTIVAGQLSNTFTLTAGTTAGTTSVTATLPASMGSISAVANITIPDAPKITSFTPVMGPGGTVVTLTGSRFTGATQVRFGDLNATTFTVVSATEITATAPANGVTGPICVTIPGPFTGCSTTPFTFPPRITGFAPGTGSAGDTITINGANFHNASAVSFTGAAAGEFTVNTAGTAITVIVPDGATTGTVSVTTPAGTATSTTNFGVPPEVTGFSPTRGGTGAAVTISGLRFTGATAVTFNGVSATFSVISDTTIEATVPATATTGLVGVTTAGGTGVSAAVFTVVDVAAVTTFSPIKGTPGTVVTITGSNFTGATSVQFGGAAASFTVNDDTQITATVPVGAVTGPITITTPEGTSSSSNLFFLPPVLSSFAPNSGSVGTPVTISGSNLLGAISVTFNGVEATFTVVANDRINTTVPANATTGTLTVTTQYGPASSALNFTVYAPTIPTIVATATSTTSVVLSWTGDPTHTYAVRRIVRKTDYFDDHEIARVTGTTFTDNTAAAGVTYLYNVLDVSSGQPGNSDYATTILFVDDPLNAGMIIKAVHLTQIRAAVNAMRVAGALATRTWTDPSPAGLPPRPVHINELRTALNEALLALNRYAAFTDVPVESGDPVLATHFRELRAAVK